MQSRSQSPPSPSFFSRLRGLPGSPTWQKRQQRADQTPSPKRSADRIPPCTGFDFGSFIRAAPFSPLDAEENSPLAVKDCVRPSEYITDTAVSSLLRFLPTATVLRLACVCRLWWWAVPRIDNVWRRVGHVLIVNFGGDSTPEKHHAHHCQSRVHTHGDGHGGKRSALPEIRPYGAATAEPTTSCSATPDNSSVGPSEASSMLGAENGESLRRYFDKTLHDRAWVDVDLCTEDCEAAYTRKASLPHHVQLANRRPYRLVIVIHPPGRDAVWDLIAACRRSTAFPAPFRACAVVLVEPPDRCAHDPGLRRLFDLVVREPLAPRVIGAVAAGAGLAMRSRPLPSAEGL